MDKTESTGNLGIMGVIGIVAALLVLIIAVWAIILSGKSQHAKIDAKKNAFNMNVNSWMNQPELRSPAQLKLAPDYEKVVRLVVEKCFTNHVHADVEAAGRYIWNIAGFGAIPIMLEYCTNDDRVVVSENVKWWYGAYNPGAILNRIDRLEKMTNGTAPLIPPPTPTIRKTAGTEPTKTVDLLAVRELRKDISVLREKIWHTENDIVNCGVAARLAWNNLALWQVEKDIAADRHDLAELRSQLQEKVAELNQLLPPPTSFRKSQS